MGFGERGEKACVGELAGWCRVLSTGNLATILHAPGRRRCQIMHMTALPGRA